MPVPLYLCVHVRDFAAQTLGRLRPELRKRPVAILDGDPPLETVFALNQWARDLGIVLGMSRLQTESFDGISLSPREKQHEDSAFLILMHCGERISPRIEVLASPEENSSGATLILDVSASERLFGTPEQIAIALQRNMDAAGFEACIATSGNAYAAVLAARGFHGTTVISPGKEANILAPLPVTVLELEPEQQETFTSWGIKTLGALAASTTKSADRKDWAGGLSASGVIARRISTSVRSGGAADGRHSERKHRVGTSGRSAGAAAVSVGQDAGTDCRASSRTRFGHRLCRDKACTGWCIAPGTSSRSSSGAARVQPSHAAEVDPA